MGEDENNRQRALARLRETVDARLNECGMSAEDLSQLAGVDGARLSQFWQDGTGLDRLDVEAIALALDIPLKEVFPFEELSAEDQERLRRLSRSEGAGVFTLGAGGRAEEAAQRQLEDTLARMCHYQERLALFPEPREG